MQKFLACAGPLLDLDGFVWPDQDDGRRLVLFSDQEGEAISGENGDNAHRSNQVQVAAQNLEDGDFVHSRPLLPLGCLILITFVTGLLPFVSRPDRLPQENYECWVKILFYFQTSLIRLALLRISGHAR